MSINGNFQPRSGSWENASPSSPCPICGKPDECSFIPGIVACCRKRGINHAGIHKMDAAGRECWIYNLSGGSYETIKNASHENDNASHKNNKENLTASGNKQVSRADSATLHKIYSALLTRLTLSANHRENLHRRGLTDEQITFLEYKSIPSDKKEKRSIARILCKEFSQKACRSVPGIHVGEDQYHKGKLYADINCQPGVMVIPVRNLQGEIVALRVRKNDPLKIIEGKAESRYYWLSSKKGSDCASSGVHIHVPKNFSLHQSEDNSLKQRHVSGNAEDFDKESIYKFYKIRLTEGEIKADIATAISGIPTLSIPGVRCWALLSGILSAIEPQIISIAFDADAGENPDVAGPLNDLSKALIFNGFTVELESWDKALGKGIDDLLAGGHEPEIVSGEDVTPHIEKLLESAKAARPAKADLDLAAAMERIGDIRKRIKEKDFLLEEENIDDLSTIRQSRRHWLQIKISLSAKILKDVEEIIDEHLRSKKAQKAAQDRMVNIDLRGGMDGNDGNNIPPDGTNVSPSNNEAEESVDKFNKEHAIIAVGSNVLVLWEKEDPTTGLMTWYFITKSHFILYYENVPVLVRDENNHPTVKKAAQHWLEHPRRRFYKGIIFDPQNEKPGYFNIWKGFGCEAKPGDWSLFRNHILENICNENQDHFNYLMAWMADAVQNPANKPGVAVVLCGEQGTGKGRFADCFGRLFGRHYKKITKSSHLVGNFNAHLQEALILFADEAFWAGDKQGESALKAEITESTRVLEMKGKDPIEVPNLTRFILASNADWVIPAGHEERRYFVLNISNQQRQQHEYFEKLTEQMENGGYEALLYDLLKMDITNINLRQAPNTEALLEQKFRSFDSVEKFWHEVLHRGTILKNDEDWRGFVRTDVLHNEYIEMAIRLGVSYRYESRGFGRKLRQMCPGIVRRYRNIEIFNSDSGYAESRRVWCLEFPSLAECRSSFEIYLKNATVDWAQDHIELETQREPGIDDEDDMLFAAGTENGTVAVNAPF